MASKLLSFNKLSVDGPLKQPALQASNYYKSNSYPAQIYNLISGC